MITLSEWADWQAAAGAGGLEVRGPYQEVKARIVSFGVRFFYTGAAATASGVVTVTADRSVTITPSQTTKSISVAQSTAGAGITSTSSWANTDFGTVTPILDAFTVTERPEVPLRVVPRRLDEDKPWLDRYQQPFILTDTATGVSVFATSVSANLPIFNALYDDSWEIGCITFSGAAVGTTYRFETAVCVEYQPVVTSPIAKLSKKPTKIISSDKMKQIEQKVSNKPIATDDGKPVTKEEINAVGGGSDGRPPPTGGEQKKNIKRRSKPNNKPPTRPSRSRSAPSGPLKGRPR